MKMFLRVITIYLLGISCVSAVDKNQASEAYSLRLTWWIPPKIQGPIFIIPGAGQSKEPISVACGIMEFSGAISYSGGPNLILAQRVESVNTEGKPVITYERVAEVNLANAGSKEIGIILTQNPKTGAITNRLLNLNDKEFPYGTFSLINFSKAKATANVNGTIIKANPGQKIVSAAFNSRSIVEVAIKVQPSEQEAIEVTNAEIVLDSTARVIYFLSESNLGGETDYSSKCIRDSAPPPAKSPTPSEGKDKGVRKNPKD